MHKQVVNSYNEWDLLEEVIVGNIDFATIPSWHIMLDATMPDKHKPLFKKKGGELFDKHFVEKAKRDLDELVNILQREGVIVKRPDVVQFNKPFNTPKWGCKGGVYAAMPRDILFVIGNEIIESPLSWRSRYFEIDAYRTLIKSYFKEGCIWTSAPKPQLLDDLYDNNYDSNYTEPETKYVINEFEPVFDAADFIRCGRDIFYQKSNVTNQFGVDWLSRHLAGRFKFHEIKVKDRQPMHIDATFMPLAPGKVLVNESRIAYLPDMLKKWEILIAPKPCISNNFDLFMSSNWISMNILMLDHKRVIVEKEEVTLIESFKKWGFEPILCSFRNFNRFGGSFHCATTDIRRKGKLESYF
jgi:glycine amidinotransferase